MPCTDPLTVEGKYQVKIPLPFVPGSEASGTVIEVGSKDSSFRIGDKVGRTQKGSNDPDGVKLCSTATPTIPLLLSYWPRFYHWESVTAIGLLCTLTVRAEA